MTVDAFAGGALGINDMVEWAVAVKQGPHQATFLDIDILDAAFALGKLLVVTVLAGVLREEQRTAKTLGLKVVKSQ